MTKTGQTFEMNPDTFTLDNIFAMELHRFQDTIAEIVTAATKELSIEKVRPLGRGLPLGRDFLWGGVFVRL